jgi:O-antigen/teichoic acid export membrane protein
MNQPKRRVLAGVVAHFYAQGVTILTQLATLPIFLARWSTEEYGHWITLSAIPVYLSLGDFGIVTAGGNMMTMYRARGEIDEMNRVFQSSILIVIVLVPLFAVLTVVPLMWYGFGLGLDERMALSALILASLLNVACGLFDSAYRPFGKYPKVTVLLTSARVVDWMGTIAGLYLHGTLASAAIGLLCGRIISCTVIFAMAKREVPELEWNIVRADGKLVRQLVRSGIGFLSFPIGNMLTLQGMVILVGAQLGGAAVALFNTSRTLARLLAQLAILTGKSTAPEISRLYGAGKDHEGDVLIKQVLMVMLPLTIVGALGLELLGPFILEHWSRGKIEFDRTVFTWLVAGAIFASYWQIRATKLTATNRHSMLAGMFLVVSASALVITYFTEKRFGVSAPAAATCLIEVAMILCNAWNIRRLRPIALSAA